MFSVRGSREVLHFYEMLPSLVPDSGATHCRQVAPNMKHCQCLDSPALLGFNSRLSGRHLKHLPPEPQFALVKLEMAG